MKRKTIDIITLGCSKNLVDSEHLMRQLEEVGFHVTHDAERPKGQIAVINTCGFIGDAKEESINMILEFAQAKEEGNLEKLYVMGCLSERYLKELAVEISQVDKFYGQYQFGRHQHTLLCSRIHRYTLCLLFHFECTEPLYRDNIPLLQLPCHICQQ
jgi:ribosomal protein S12 methylthiotransferase